ncbi:MAG: hypothetical protein N2C14_31410, partial [Planctomycetales bacterium]
MTEPQPEPTTPRRGFFPFRRQFTIRSLFGLTALAAMLLAWEVNRTRKQREAVEAIERLAGTVEYESWAPEWACEILGGEHFRQVVHVTAPVDSGGVVIPMLTAFPRL